VLSDLPAPADARVLVDYRTADDAGVYRLDEERALVQTVDFFTPIVDDPACYGAIAAANALSDVYAMGGRPLTALAIAALPARDFDEAVARAIFRGGADKLAEAGVVLLGGHTVQDQEVKFGYAVTGLVHPAQVWTNAGASPGDLLVLTKPLGTGIIGTAIKHDRAPAESVEAAVASMTRLNRAAAEALHGLPGRAVRACTDVTGFGLLGHACEVAAASGATLRIVAGAVPLLPGVLDLAARNRPGGTASNMAHFGAMISGTGDIDANLLAVLHDPQTSGGLLVALAPADVGAALAALAAAGVTAAVVGEVVARQETAVVLVPR
jgi:selenide,water dikinase